MGLYGQTKVFHHRDKEWEQYIHHFESVEGARNLFLVEFESVQTSCDYAVPEYQFLNQRETLTAFAQKKGESGIKVYWKEQNLVSIDGLPTDLLPKNGRYEEEL